MPFVLQTTPVILPTEGNEFTYVTDPTLATVYSRDQVDITMQYLVLLGKTPSIVVSAAGGYNIQV